MVRVKRPASCCVFDYERRSSEPHRRQGKPYLYRSGVLARRQHLLKAQKSNPLPLKIRVNVCDVSGLEHAVLIKRTSLQPLKEITTLRNVSILNDADPEQHT